MKKEIYFDSSEPELIRSLMEECGDSEFPYYGKNEDGEDIAIHIGKTDVIHITYQNNGWIRKNYFDENGFPNGEIFDGKWK